MKRSELTPSALVTLLRQSVSSNKIAILVGTVYLMVILFFRYAPYAPLPSQTSLAVPADWASWFDVYVTFPMLTLLCLLPFRSSMRESTTLLCTVTVVPLYLVFSSYYFYYAQTPLGLGILSIPLTLVVPTIILVTILSAPLLNSIVLTWSLTQNKVSKIGLVIGQTATKLYFLAAASLSVAAALLQAYLRSALPAIALTNWVSDVGITVDAGARDIVARINPYTHGLPPWGGNGGTLGPVTYLLAVPFTFLSPGWAAHAGALFYAILTSAGIWKCMQLYYKGFAVPCAAFFLALPTTSYAIEVGITSHLELAALIVWNLFMFLRARFFWSGLISGLGLLTLGIPGFLVILYIVGAGNRTNKLRILAGFLAPVILALSAVLAIFPPSFLLSEVSTAYSNFGKGWLTPDLIFSSAFIKIISIITTGWLFFWLMYSGAKINNDNRKLLVVIATFLLIIPFTIANYFAFFYVWGSSVVVMAMFSLLARQQGLTVDTPRTLEISC